MLELLVIFQYYLAMSDIVIVELSTLCTVEVFSNHNVSIFTINITVIPSLIMSGSRVVTSFVVEDGRFWDGDRCTGDRVEERVHVTSWEVFPGMASSWPGGHLRIKTIFNMSCFTEHKNAAVKKFGTLFNKGFISVIIVKVNHLCTTNFMNYIPIFIQLLKELPW